MASRGQRFGLSLMLMAIFLMLMALGAMMARDNFTLPPALAIVDMLVFFGGMVFLNNSN